jgi:tRNA A-37 threonylcarbamoyl transferase component Bud32
MTINKNNLSIFGISKVKTLTDFVTTEQDVKKGNNRLPLNLARMYEEDLMTKEEVEKAKVEMKM